MLGEGGSVEVLNMHEEFDSRAPLWISRLPDKQNRNSIVLPGRLLINSSPEHSMFLSASANSHLSAELPLVMAYFLHNPYGKLGEERRKRPKQRSNDQAT